MEQFVNVTEKEMVTFPREKRFKNLKETWGDNHVLDHRPVPHMTSVGASLAEAAVVPTQQEFIVILMGVEISLLDEDLLATNIL